MKKEQLEFKRFLEKNGVWKEYVDNINDVKMGGAISKVGEYENMNQFLNGQKPQDWLFNAFFFHKTNNPVKWVHLSAEWNHELNNGFKSEVSKMDFSFQIEIEQFVRIKEICKFMGLSPEKFAEIAIDKFLQETESNIKQGKEQS